MRLLALVAARNEMRYLPGFVDSLAGQVDGVVALDDGSTDGTGEFLASRPEVLEVLRNPPDRAYWDEPGNYRRLVEAALRHEPDWLISLDCDERLEHDFRSRAERVVWYAKWFGLTGFAVRLRELWDSPDTYRVDGVWGQKCPPRLFRVGEGRSFDDRPLHAPKVPLESRVFGAFPVADLILYHLRMIRDEDRQARRRRYESLDPEARWQLPGFGYSYLTDRTGLKLRSVPRRRAFNGRVGA